MSIKTDVIILAVAAAVLVGAAYYAKKKVEGAVAGVADAAGEAWENMATYAGGVLTGYGDYLDATTQARDELAGAVGPVGASTDDAALYDKFKAGTDFFAIPKTNMTECERAMAEGRTWDASFACPAGTFIDYLRK